MTGGRLVIRPHDPVRARIRLAVAAVLTLALAWMLFAAGRMQAGYDFAAAREERREMLNALQRSEREVQELRERASVAERSSQVDRQSHDDLRESLVTLNEEILRLREELAFYRGIVSPADARRGLQVQGLRLDRAGSDAHWRFRLTLIQAMQHDRQAQGVARLTVVGGNDGTPQRVSLADLGEHGDGIPYDFRYFQEFDGDILLPQGFVPNRVEVELVPRNARDGRIERVFDWPSA